MARWMLLLLVVSSELLVGHHQAVAKDEPPVALPQPGPCVVVAVDPGERWVAACVAGTDTAPGSGVEEPTAGGARRLVLHRSTGETTLLDSFVSASRDGRFTVTIQRGRLMLEDHKQHTQTDLSSRGADARDPDPKQRRHRAASFSADGRHVLYLRTPSNSCASSVIVVRDLETGREREVDAGGLVFSARFAGDTGWISASVVTEDTNGNGRFDFPWLREKARRWCTDQKGDSEVVYGDHACDLGGRSGAPRLQIANRVEGYVGSHSIRRFAEEQLVVGNDQELEGSVLGGGHAHLALISSAHSSVVVAEQTSRDSARVVFWKNHAKRKLCRIPVDGVLRCGLDYARWDWAPVCRSELFVNMRSGITRLVEGDILAHWDDAVLVREGTRVIWFHLDTGESVEIDADLMPKERADFVLANGFVASGGRMIDLREPTAVKSYTGAAAYISQHGRVLVAVGREGDVLEGPLTWCTPK